MIVSAMLALEMKNWVICGETIERSGFLCEEGDNIRLKTLHEAAKVLPDIVKGHVSVDVNSLKNVQRPVVKSTETCPLTIVCSQITTKQSRPI